MNDDYNDDVQFEHNDEAGEPLSAQAKIKKLREELQEAHKKRDEYLDGWQRCKADSINARKDAIQDAKRAGEREKDSFVADILPVLDSFENAGASEAFANMSEEWQEGIRRIQNQLLNILTKHGVERFGIIGDVFDPRLHEAVQETSDAPGDPHTIAAVLRHGYRADDPSINSGQGRVIRPAQVVVKV